MRLFYETTQIPAYRGCGSPRPPQALFGREYQEGAPDYCLVLRHGYDSLEDLHAALESGGREAVWAELDKVMPLFSGRVIHVNYETVTLRL